MGLYVISVYLRVRFSRSERRSGVIIAFMNHVSSHVASDGPCQLHEEVLRDPRYPVHEIADQLEPYLLVLLEKFQPQQVIIFGSHAYGKPTEHSDVDLLIIKPLEQSPVREAISIRKAWRPVRASVGPLPFDLIVTSPEDHEHRLSHSAGFYEEIVERGLRIA